MKNSKFIAGILTLVATGTFCLVISSNNHVTTRGQVANISEMTNTSSTFVEQQIRLGKKPNRLAREKSPYLLQHAFNPVDWYPWGEEAFTKAKEEDKPIFLSIGYSTCYWCHVMEREVFEDTAIARLMNEKLICIKVDREERPDIDRVYMTAVQAITGSGGWPMSIFMTPDRKPFFGGTYIPPRAQYGRPGFPDLVKRIDEIWHQDRAKINESSQQITELLRSHTDSTSSAQLTAAVSDSAYRRCLENYDDENAGFGSGPKFPRPVVFNFLLRYYARTGQNSALQITLSTLRAMRNGGMYDHIGGGFHRYSVDGKWRVPHFEKMLYDQAQLVSSYLEAYQITHDELFASTSKDVLAYVIGKLKDSHGGFYSAEDAESSLDFSKPEEKEEGTFYIWTKTEIDNLLGPEHAYIFNYYYGVTDTGNALQDPQQVFIGKNILYIAHSVEETAEHFRLSPNEVKKILSDARSTLNNKRELRPHPHLDDKIITAWNGLMISAFAKAYQILHDDTYREVAVQSAEFTMSHLYHPQDQTLSRRYRDGEARFEGGLEDYTFLTKGLIDLYEATFDERWLNDAIRLTQKQIELFWDTTNGGFYDITGHDSTILARTKEDYDGAEPAGNSIAAENLLRLSQMTDNNEWRSLAEKTISSFGKNLEHHPEVMPQMLSALEWNLSPSKEIIIAGNASSDETKMLLEEVHAHFIPNKVVLLVNRDEQSGIMNLLPFTAGMNLMNGKAAAYICEHYACQLPTTDKNVVAQLLTSHKHNK